MTALSPAPLSTRQFLFTHGELVAEASDLGAFVSRLFDDACDVGFRLESHYTGAIVTYVHLLDERDGEGELLASVYVPADSRDSAPRVRVFND